MSNVLKRAARLLTEEGKREENTSQHKTNVFQIRNMKSTLAALGVACLATAIMHPAFNNFIGNVYSNPSLPEEKSTQQLLASLPAIFSPLSRELILAYSRGQEEHVRVLRNQFLQALEQEQERVAEIGNQSDAEQHPVVEKWLVALDELRTAVPQPLGNQNIESFVNHLKQADEFKQNFVVQSHLADKKI